jgi:hypothetical protein
LFGREGRLVSSLMKPLDTIILNPMERNIVTIRTVNKTVSKTVLLSILKFL